MGKEEQDEEREVLDSIFPDEITDIDEHSFRISVTLDLDNQDESQPSIWLTVTYPETYPDVAPRLDLTLPPSSSKIPDLDVSSDKVGLLESLESTIEENLGMAMVFTLVSTLKENVEQLVGERRSAVTRAKEAEAEAAEAKENEKFFGTPVTPETFGPWRDAFVKEMAQIKAKEKEEREAEDRRRGRSAAGGVVGGENKLTGRQLWERGLVGKAGEEDEEDDDGVDALKGVEKLSVKA